MNWKCPICGKSAKLGDPDFPFCGERCRLIDLGAWLSELHKIPDERTAEDQLHPDSAEES